MALQDKLAWIWLAEGLGYAASNSGKVLEEYPGGPEEMLQGKHLLSHSKTLREGQVKRLSATSPGDYAPLFEQMQKRGVQAFGFGEEGYPELLRCIYDPPPVLYVQGDEALLAGPLHVGMVGARRPSAYGAEVVRRLGRELAQRGALIVSGLAAGLDTEAHNAALAVGAPTVACIAFGHDRCYPAANRGLMQTIARCGAVVSEYPLGTQGLPPYYVQRNRLIAGLSHGLVVTEARIRSGTASTVDFAIDYGRDVFAVPGDIFSELSSGTHQMLREGAYMAACAEDVLSVLEGQTAVPIATKRAHTRQKPAAEKRALVQNQLTENETQTPSASLAALGEEARRVLGVLQKAPKNLLQICEETKLPPGRAMAALTELELAGLSRQLAGRQFVIV